jgi:hypothetical protein
MIPAVQPGLLLRDQSQHNGQKLADVAAAIVDSRVLLATAEHSA